MARRVIFACFLGASLIVAVGATPYVSAAPVGDSPMYTGKILPSVPRFPSYFEITAQGYYCATDGTACIPPSIFACQNGSTCPGLNYGDAEAYGAVVNATSGTPGDLYLECDRFTDSGYQQAVLDIVSPAGVSAYGPRGIFGVADNGTISGKGTLPGPSPYNDMDSAEVSSISASGFDLTTKTTGSATGVQNTENGPEIQNSGQIRITIRGTITSYDPTGNPTGTTPGTMSCVAGGSGARQTGTAMGEGILSVFYS